MALRNLSSMQHISEHSFGEPVIEANMRFLQMSNEGNIIFIQRATVMLLVVVLEFHLRYDYCLFQDLGGYKILRFLMKHW